MTRITEQTVTSEAVAQRIVINWNARDNTGAVTFAVDRMESIDGDFVRDVPETPISVPLEEFLTRTFLVGTTEVPGELIQGYIKVAFDTLYRERQALLNAPPEPVNPEEEP